ncbi:MAG: glycosyltransferase family 4 protein [Prevotella sp.]|nr:glycosyltransferase family 4 protein [Prevotella sp.]
MPEKSFKIVYCTPALYMAGGVERVLTLKANYFAEHFGYDITIILTEGKDKPLFYPLSDKIKVINLDINFEEMWTCSFLKKAFVYLKKQRIFKKRLSEELLRIRPDITMSLLRREINFINEIQDGSKKIGELHVNRANYRNFEAGDSNVIKNLFAKYWMRNLVSHLKKLNRFVVLTEEDKASWTELDNVEVIPDPLAFDIDKVSPLTNKRVIAVGRYVYQKGFDLLLQAWAKIEKQHPDWELAIYGMGDRTPYKQIIEKLHIDRNRCHLNGPTDDIKQEYLNSSLFVFSSRFEGFGMVLIEAMACGLPVISFDCPCGPKDIVRHQEDGILVPSGDITLLANAMNQLMSDDTLRQEMSSKAVLNVRRFQLDVITQKWKSLFDSVAYDNK